MEAIESARPGMPLRREGVSAEDIAHTSDAGGADHGMQIALQRASNMPHGASAIPVPRRPGHAFDARCRLRPAQEDQSRLAYPCLEDGRWALPHEPQYVRQPLPWFGQPGQIGSVYVNAIGLAERLDYAQLYRVEAPGHSLSHGFTADMSLAVAHREAARPHLFCLDSFEAAVAYGEQKYGASFVLYSLDPHGLPAVPYRLHAILCTLLGEVRASKASAYERGDVYLDIDDLTLQRVRAVPVSIVAAGLQHLTDLRERQQAQMQAEQQRELARQSRSCWGRSCSIV